MFDELTEIDIKKMQEEIDYREAVLKPQLGEELKRTRELGDLSENAEYVEAKRAKRKNDGRIRYLRAMINTAKIVEVDTKDGSIGLFSWVLIFNEKMQKEKKIQIVTTLRQDATRGFVSKESPLGKALMGKKAGDRVEVFVNEDMSYFVKIISVEDGVDNDDLPISGY